MPERKQAFEDFAITKVPDDQLRSTFGLFLVYTGVLICVAVIWGGGALGNTLTMADIAIATVIGCIILGVIGFLTATIGGYCRTSTYVILRYPFGRMGSMVAGAAVSGVACGIGWFFIQAWLFGIVFQTVATELMGTAPFWAQAPIAALWGAVLMTLTAVFGYRGLAMLSYLAVPLFLIALGAGAFAAITEAGGLIAAAAATPANPSTAIASITAIVGMYIAGATITSDVSRYAEKPTGAGWAWFWQVVILMPLLMLAGGSLTLLTPTGDVAQAMTHLGIGLGALVLIIFGQWTTNDNNLYNGALAFANTLRVKKAYITIAMGIIGAALASMTAAGLFGPDPFIAFLNQLGRFLPPIAGVLIADFYLLRPWLGKKDPATRYQFGPNTQYSRFNIAGLASWIIAGLVSAYIPGIVALNSVLLGFVLYLVLARGLKAAGISYEIGTYTEAEDGF